MEERAQYPLSPLCKAWLDIVRSAFDFKKSRFQNDADTAMKFFHCGAELSKFLWEDRLKARDGEQLPAPTFRILVAKVAELVQLIGPSLYHKNPTIIVDPKFPELPLNLLLQLVPPELMQQAQMAAQQQGQQFNPQTLFPPDPTEPESHVVAELLQYYLDYMQRENDKKTHSRRMIDEALIKGMGVLWTESFQPYEGGPTLVGSFYDSINHLLVDPDVDTFEDAKYIIRRRFEPIYWVAKKYHLKESFLRKKYGTHESLIQQSHLDQDPDGDRKRKTGTSCDMMEYWEIYSKMGMGHRLAYKTGESTKEGEVPSFLDDDTAEFLDKFGPNCMIVVAHNVPFPLNLPNTDFEAAITEPDEDKAEDLSDAAFLRCQWPIPFWSDGSWPCTTLAFHDVPNSPWPMSHVKPGLGYLEFMTWCMSFLCNKIRTSCATVASVMKAAGDELKEQLFNGKDFRLLEVEKDLVPDGDVSKIAHFFEMPTVNTDIWKILEACSVAFDKATGLSELLYGTAGGMRSAKEASIKEGHSQTRIDDMASKVEDAMSLVARKEAMAARWLPDEDDLFPVLGQRCTALWMQYVNSKDIDAVAREFHYRVEAGSARKPNKDTRIDQINQAIQVWAPVIQWSLQSGNTGLTNAFISAWGKAADLEVKDFLLPPPPPPPPNPMQQKIEAEIEQGKQELEMKKQELGMKQEFEQAKLGMEQQKVQMQLEGQKAKTQADIEKAQIDMQIAREKAGMDMQIEQAKAQNDLQLGQAKLQGDLRQQEMAMDIKRQEGQQKLQLGAAEGVQKLKINEAQTDADIAAKKKQAAMKPKGDKK